MGLKIKTIKKFAGKAGKLALKGAAFLPAGRVARAGLAVAGAVGAAGLAKKFFKGKRRSRRMTPQRIVKKIQILRLRRILRREQLRSI